MKLLPATKEEMEKLINEQPDQAIACALLFLEGMLDKKLEKILQNEKAIAGILMGMKQSQEGIEPLLRDLIGSKHISARG